MPKQDHAHKQPAAPTIAASLTLDQPLPVKLGDSVTFHYTLDPSLVPGGAVLRVGLSAKSADGVQMYSDALNAKDGTAGWGTEGNPEAFVLGGSASTWTETPQPATVTAALFATGAGIPYTEFVSTTFDAAGG